MLECITVAMIVAHTKCNRRDVNRMTYIVKNREKHKDALTKKGNNFIVVKLTFNIARRTKTGWEKPHPTFPLRHWIS